MNRLPVLLTRPARGNAEFAEALRGALGSVEIIENPLLEIVPQEPVELPGPEDGVIFTSARAVEVFSNWQEGAGRRAWCVGSRTAEAAREAGFAAVAGDGAAAHLPALLGREDTVPPLWHLRGLHQRRDVAAELQALGYDCRSIVIYDQRALPLAGQIRTRIEAGEAMVAPLFSPRTAGLLAAEVKNIGANLRVVALSSAVADKWPAPSAVAERPDAAAMLEAVRREVG
ncbi:MAG: uroporphyrinogen-III synthase [Vannielia sp.]|uniref:uroporphyrinogen-III synthase n=1 Tax=Vannielia sp. TaxID=2813045 RepID=UPI003B8DE887